MEQEQSGLKGKCVINGAGVGVVQVAVLALEILKHITQRKKRKRE